MIVEVPEASAISRLLQSATAGDEEAGASLKKLQLFITQMAAEKNFDVNSSGSIPRGAE